MCLDRNCENCNVSKISEHYKDIVKHVLKVENKSTGTHVKKAETEKRTMSCVSKTTSDDQFLHDYEQDMISYPAHTFRASCNMSRCQHVLRN